MALKFSPREEQDQFFWYVNDLIKKARSGYGGPSTYEEWLEHNPKKAIKAWLDDEAKRYIDTTQLQTDWGSYCRNPCEDTLDIACQHCYENILIDTLVVIEGMQQAAFADAIREVLPKQLRPMVDIDSLPAWLSYTQAAELIEARSGKRYKIDSIRRLVYRKKLTPHPNIEGRVSRKSCHEFAH